MQQELFTGNNEQDFIIGATKHTSCHWELKEGEIWVGNTNVFKGLVIPDYLLNKLTTIRLGEQAYDVHHKPIERWYMRPLIIHKSESLLFDNIMMAKLK